MTNLVKPETYHHVELSKEDHVVKLTDGKIKLIPNLKPYINKVGILDLHVNSLCKYIGM